MISRLKHFIHRILPSSKSQINDRFDRLNQRIDDLHKTTQNELEQKVAALTKDNFALQKKLDTLSSALNKQESDLKTLITVDHEEYKSSVIKYNNQYEYRIIKCFQTAYRSDDYKSKFLALIKDLDHQSIKKIVTILRRQQLVWEKQGNNIDLYTQSEQNEIKDLKKYMLNHIFQISDKLFCYDQYFLPICHFEASVFYFKHGINELQKKSIDHVKGKDIIDVGGFIGDSVLILEDLFPHTIYTFEGVQKNFELLQETLRINTIQNCIAEHLALGSETGQVTFNIKGASSNMQTINYLEQIEGQETVEITTLDAYASKHNMNIGLIKVDIEGAEQQFLQGARKTIEKFRPVLLISIYHNADDFFGIKPMIENWNLGYRFHIHKPCDHSISREVLLLCEATDYYA